MISAGSFQPTRTKHRDHSLVTDEPVLSVDQKPVEPNMRQDLRHKGLGTLHQQPTVVPPPIPELP